MFFSGRTGRDFGRSSKIGKNSGKPAHPWIPVGTHAEIDLINKTRERIRRGKRLPKVDMFIVRLSATGKAGCARPCYHCLLQMARTTDISIKRVYYTDSDGNVACESLETMLDSPTRHFSHGYKANKRCKMK